MQNLEAISIESACTAPTQLKGLLASGWVDAKMKAFRPALIPWKELRQRDVLDPFVQEAILVIPYALAESGLNKPSARAYEEATGYI